MDLEPASRFIFRLYSNRFHFLPLVTPCQAFDSRARESGRDPRMGGSLVGRSRGGNPSRFPGSGEGVSSDTVALLRALGGKGREKPALKARLRFTLYSTDRVC